MSMMTTVALILGTIMCVAEALPEVNRVSASSDAAGVEFKTVHQQQ